MVKVDLNPESAKTDYQSVSCFICNSQVEATSEESRSWFRYKFCSISCMDLFKAKFN